MTASNVVGTDDDDDDDDEANGDNDEDVDSVVDDDVSLEAQLMILLCRLTLLSNDHDCDFGLAVRL